MKNVIHNAQTSIFRREWNVYENIYCFLIAILCFVFGSLSVSAQTDVSNTEYQVSRQMAAAMKAANSGSYTTSDEATRELEKEINSVLNDIRVLLMDENTKIRFEADFAPEMYRQGEQACPSISLKNLITGTDSYGATIIVSDQELKHALDLLNKAIDFLGIK